MSSTGCVNKGVMMSTQEMALAGLCAYKKAIDELFIELGNKRAGDWGIINDNLIKGNDALEKIKEAISNN